MGPTNAIFHSLQQVRLERLTEALKATLAILRDHATINDSVIAIQVSQAQSILNEFGCSRISPKNCACCEPPSRPN